MTRFEREQRALALDLRHGTVHEGASDDLPVEFPTVNDNHAGLGHRFVYAVSAPLLPTIRWHGMTIVSGLRPVAAPAARTADGRPHRRASSPYEIVAPNGTAPIAAQTARWNSVPRRSNGTSDSRRPDAGSATSDPANSFMPSMPPACGAPTRPTWR